MRVVSLIVFLKIYSIALFAQTYTLHGVIKDSLTGETLVGANIYIAESRQGTVTNAYGFYSLHVPQGETSVVYSYLGYKPVKISVNMVNNIQKNILLQPVLKELNEVSVRANRTNAQQYTTSLNKITAARIKSITTATGEPDVFKALQLMPGIQAVNEGASNLYVRGGSYDQNLILLDEAPVYNPTHALGFFSSFNTDAIKNVTVYKGAFPAQYGGRLSSVVDITMREGNYNKMQVNAGLGLIASRLSIEGPIVKDKASFILSGRYSYAGQTLNLLAGKIGKDLLELKKLLNFNDNNKIWFYDFNAKVNFKINDKNHIYFSNYCGHDQFYSYVLNNQNSLKWGNFTTTLRWNQVISTKLFANYTLYSSNYNYQYTIIEDIRNFYWKSNIKETGAKADFSLYLNPDNNIKYGLTAISHFFKPGSISPADTSSIITPFSLEHKRSYDLTAYLSNEQAVFSWLTLNYGVRYTIFMNTGPGIVYTYNYDMTAVTDSTSYNKGEIINTYNGFEPRLAFNIKINNNNALKLAYAYTKQYMHLLSSSTVGLPTDTWMPADKHIKPQSSNQYVLGYYHTFAKSQFEFSAETYYKSLNHIIDYKDNADLFLNKQIENQLLSGKGYSFGLELLLEKKSGRLSGWIGYTLAKTQHKINGVNQNRYFSPRYDIRHNLSFTSSLNINKSWSVSTTFKLASGGFVTLPDQVFVVDEAAFFYYSSRNNYKMPPYHRLDLSVTYSNPKNETRRLKGQWVLSVYNVYNRKNIYSLYVKQNSWGFTDASVYKMYLYGIMPSVSYNLSF